MASEEDEDPVWISDEGPFVVVTDPLDGSRNIDASIPTGGTLVCDLSLFFINYCFVRINWTGNVPNHPFGP